MDAAAWCGHLVKPGSVCAFLAEHRRRLFPDELFSDLFASNRGRPSVPAGVIATVMVLQSLHGLSDRDAVDELRTDIAWKVACGLTLTDEGFHSTVLTLWRNRLRQSKDPQRIFNAVRTVVAETGVLRGRDRRAIDATVLDDAVTTQDAVMQLVSAIRRVRREIDEAGALELTTHSYDTDPGKPACAWDDPEARDALVTALVRDALATLEACQGVDLAASQQEAVGLLGLVAGQDVEEGDTPGTWRIARQTRYDRMVSVVDPDARHVHKTVHAYRDGYKAHVAVEPETGLVTSCAVSTGTTPEHTLARELLADEDEPVEVLGDSAYSAGATRAALRADGHRLVIKPAPLRPAVPGGFTKDDFRIDFEARTVTCPAGTTVSITRSGSATFGARCRGCPLRERCHNQRHGKTLKIHPHEAELIEARRVARTKRFERLYKQLRPMVERTLAWLVRGGHRKVRYRGRDRNELWWSNRCAAVNLHRLITLGLRYQLGWLIE